MIRNKQSRRNNDRNYRNRCVGPYAGLLRFFRTLQIRDSGKLQRWGIAYDAVDRIVDRLVQEKYIDEDRYCRAFVRDKYRFDKWGKVKIAQALQLKKISPYVYNLMLNEIDEEEYLGILQRLLESKRKSVRAATPYEQNGKLVRYALSRGFEMKDIRRCIELDEENAGIE